MSEFASCQPLPLILIRGFGGPGVEDEKRLTYQGFNQGTVYPHKRGENYIYEGLILRFMKSNLGYVDATNVVGYYDRPLPVDADLDRRYPALSGLKHELFSNHSVLLDPAMAQRFVTDDQDPRRTLWVLRYYDLDNRRFGAYAEALVRLIDIIQALVRRHDELHPKRDEEGGKLPPPEEPVKVNLLAHSMGGLIAREAVQVVYPSRAKWLPTEKWGTPNNRTDQDFEAAKYINKIVTLGTPHQGIAFAVYRDFPDLLAGQEEFDRFSVTAQADPEKPWAWPWFEHCFPVDRLLTVVGTDYRSYGGNLAYAAARLANRLSNLGGPLGVAYNYSDGLVRIDKAQLPGAPRTFIHKCHGGMDSLVTARESYEVARRFLFGNVKVRLRVLKAAVLRGKDWFGKSEFFFGVCVKPRGVDFELFHQSKAGENCYGPFDLEQGHLPFTKPTACGFADDKGLIWEGWLDADLRPEAANDVVMRLEFYLGERDVWGVGFSDNLVFSKQYYVRAMNGDDGLALYLYTGEGFAAEDDLQGAKRMTQDPGGWVFDVAGTGFKGKMRIELESVPEQGEPKRLARIPERQEPVVGEPARQPAVTGEQADG